MHRNSLYSLCRHYINSFEVYNPPPSPKKECSDLKGTISSRYLLSFFVAPWIASLGPSGACGRAVWRLLGGPGDPLGGLWGRTPPNQLLGRSWPPLRWTLPCCCSCNHTTMFTQFPRPPNLLQDDPKRSQMAAKGLPKEALEVPKRSQQIFKTTQK